MQYFNGMLGAVKFEDGVSGELTHREANAICASMRAEVIEGDESQVVNRSYEMNKDKEAPVKPAMDTNKGIDGRTELEKIADEEAEASRQENKVVYTEEQLGQIADDKGIAGLREIGDKLGVKDKSVLGLIGEILATQNKQS